MIVSRTATAPFDRLKVYLITSPSQPIQAPYFCPSGSGKKITSRRGAGSIPAAVRAVWKQGGGPKAFWTGNGLNVVKIFPVGFVLRIHG
jgi:solute carrier family 25 phosphate transporter 23/24/25/41